MNCSILVFNICLLAKLPRRMSFRTRMENQISICLGDPPRPRTGRWQVTGRGANVFVAVEHANTEVVGIHASRSANRFEALEPVRQGVHRCFGTIAPGVARGLKLRHDHGSNYMSGDFQDEIECLGIESSPSFVREPEGNGV